MSHIINCKKSISSEIFLFFDIFLFCKFAFSILKNNGGVRSYFSCYRATSDRALSLLFRK